MPAYVDTIYNEQSRPYTKYPSQLCAYLFNRFGMKRNDKILEVGCGRGDFLKGFKDQGLDVYGLDREKSNSMLLKDIEVLSADIEAEAFPCEDAIFDVVFCKSLIEHLFDPENLMRESIRVLKPGGRFIIMTPDWASLMKIFFDDYTHRQPYTVEAVRDIFNIFGFNEVSSEIFYQLPILWKHPALKIASAAIRLVVPVTVKSNIKFVRWSVELMILGTGVK